MHALTNLLLLLLLLLLIPRLAPPKCHNLLHLDSSEHHPLLCSHCTLSPHHRFRNVAWFGAPGLAGGLSCGRASSEQDKDPAAHNPSHRDVMLWGSSSHANGLTCAALLHD